MNLRESWKTKRILCAILPIAATLLLLNAPFSTTTTAQAASVEPHTKEAVIAADDGWDKAEETGNVDFLDALLFQKPIHDQPHRWHILCLVGRGTVDLQHHLLEFHQCLGLGRVFERGELELAHGAAGLRMVAVPVLPDVGSNLSRHSAKASLLIAITREFQGFVSSSLTRSR